MRLRTKAWINRIKFGQFSKTDLVHIYIDLAEENSVDFDEDEIWGAKKDKLVRFLKRDFSMTDLRLACFQRVDNKTQV